jgi:hypothetical protein
MRWSRKAIGMLRYIIPGRVIRTQNRTAEELRCITRGMFERHRCQENMSNLNKSRKKVRA